MSIGIACDDLVLDPTTARAQLALHSLSHNPAGVELWHLVEGLREQQLREEARREFFNDVRDRRSSLLIEIEREGLHLRDEAIKLRRLGCIADAGRIEKKADELWLIYDELEERERDGWGDGAWREPKRRQIPRRKWRK